MKFICIRCDEQMKLIKTDNSNGDSVDIIFGCSQCGNKIAMITNPQETQMVRTLGLNIGGVAIPDKPVKEGLLEEPETSKNDGVRWTKEAEERLKRVPPFVQPMARQSIVNYAKEKGVKEITIQVMDEVKEKVGM